MPTRPRPAFVYGNFATTLDGVVSLNHPGAASGGEITGHAPHDRFLMGLLRATADAVVVGAGTLRAVPHHLWTPEHVFPSRALDFADLRRRLGRSTVPLNVVVTAGGKLDLQLPVFSSGKVPALIVTTSRGARRLSPHRLPPTTRLVVAGRSDRLTARAVLRTIQQVGRHRSILVEGGPHLIGTFLGENLLDELFLTLAPQIAGRDGSVARPGLVEGRLFAPHDPRWGSLLGARRGGDHLYLRFGFGPVRQSAPIPATRS
jgi:riboflavin biosynthesis pyrimidine reductase